MSATLQRRRERYRIELTGEEIDFLLAVVGQLGEYFIHTKRIAKDILNRATLIRETE